MSLSSKYLLLGDEEELSYCSWDSGLLEVLHAPRVQKKRVVATKISAES